MDGQSHAPVDLPPGKTRYPLYRRLRWPQGRSGMLRKITPPPGFDPRTVQPVANPYTASAIPARATLIRFVCVYGLEKNMTQVNNCQLPKKAEKQN
jgi:hypothetical protein